MKPNFESYCQLLDVGEIRQLADLYTIWVNVYRQEWTSLWKEWTRLWKEWES